MNTHPRILVIDDDNDICDVLKMFFEKRGFNVNVANTGGEAIRKSNEDFYNAALIDIKLPDMSGVDLLTQLRDTVPKMVKIMITGNAALDNAVNALNRGADAFIVKPFKPEELFVRLKGKLDEQSKDLKMTQEKIADFIEERIRSIEKKGKE